MAVLGLALLSVAAIPRKPAGPVEKVRVVAEFPHDVNAFTQGLLAEGGQILESTGRNGFSSIRLVDVKSGRVKLQADLDRRYFGEGIATVGDELYQLTWQDQVVFVYDKKTLEYQKMLRYRGEAWGLASNGQRLVLSDGTAVLKFLNPTTLAVEKRLSVQGPRGPIDKLNELEFVGDELWANVWYSDLIARIDPETGKLLGWLDLSHLFPAGPNRDRESVLNGIAYDRETKAVYVTGKNWPKVFQIERVE